MNIKLIIDNLIQINPYLKPLLTNILSAQIKENTLFIKYPDFLWSDQLIQKLNKELELFLPEKFFLNFEYMFSPFQMPFLPFPISSSKYSNKIIFFSINDKIIRYTLFDKVNLFNLFRNENKPITPIIHNIKMKNQLKVFDIIEELFLEQLPVLKDQYRYLHPLVLIDRVERSFYYELIFENVFTNIENNRKIQDVRRFVGVPAYTFIDYFHFFEDDDEN